MDLSPPIEELGLCPFGVITGKPCLLCGGTRAVLSLASLDFSSAMNYNAFVVLVGPLVSLFTWWFWRDNQASDRVRAPQTALTTLSVPRFLPLSVMLALWWVWNIGRW